MNKADFRLLMLTLGLVLLGGCASRLAVQDHLHHYVRMQAALPAERQTLWDALPPESQAPHAVLYRALLQSLPGHSGHQPQAARAALGAVAGAQGRSGVAALARLRLAELDREHRCLVEIDSLMQRLQAVVDIERALDDGGN